MKRLIFKLKIKYYYLLIYLDYLLLLLFIKLNINTSELIKDIVDNAIKTRDLLKTRSGCESYIEELDKKINLFK